MKLYGLTSIPLTQILAGGVDAYCSRGQTIARSWPYTRPPRPTESQQAAIDAMRAAQGWIVRAG